MTAPAEAPAPARRRWIVPLLVALAGLGLALAAAGVLLRPSLILVNHLVLPVRVLVDTTALTVGAGDTLRLTLRRGAPMRLRWRLDPPAGPDGGPLGVSIEGAFAVERAAGRIHYDMTSRAGGPHFAPLVTNASDRALRIVVNAGLQGAVDCRCLVPAGARRTFVGYYPLYRNSSVEARDTAGAAARFADLGAAVRPASGMVGLRFEAKDLRVRSAAAGAGRAASPR